MIREEKKKTVLKMCILWAVAVALTLCIIFIIFWPDIHWFGFLVSSILLISGLITFFTKPLLIWPNKSEYDAEKIALTLATLIMIFAYFAIFLIIGAYLHVTIVIYVVVVVFVVTIVLIYILSSKKFRVDATKK